MRRTLLPLLVVTAAAVVLAVVTNRRMTDAGDARAAELLLPALAESEAEIAAVHLARGDERVRLERGPEGWTVAELEGYPADLAAVAELVRGLADLRKVEPKTARPERHERLGLEDPVDPEATSTLVEVLDAEGAPLAAVVLGRRYFDLPGEHLFARLADADQTWLASGSVRTQLAPLQWVDAVALALGGEAVEAVTRLADGEEVFTVARADADEFEWEVTPVPEGQEVAGGGLPGRIGRLFSNLRFDRARSRADTELPVEPAHHLRAETFDGLVVELRAYSAETVAPGNAASPEGGSEVEGAAGDDDRLWIALDLSLPGPLPEDEAAAERLREELEEHRGVTADWLYRVDSFTAGAIAAGPTQVFDPVAPEEPPTDAEPLGPPLVDTEEAVPPSAPTSDG